METDKGLTPSPTGVFQTFQVRDLEFLASIYRRFMDPFILIMVDGIEVRLDRLSPGWDFYRYLGSMGEVSVETRTVPGAGEIAELYIEELEGPDATVPLPRALVAWGQIPSPGEKDRDPRPDPPDVW